MSRSLPYVQRRGDMLFFRMAVPLDLRPYIGGREITKTLQTTDRRIAAPRALFLASRVLTIFTELRTMPKDDRDGFRIDFTMEYSFDELGSPKFKFSDVKPGDEAAIIELTNKLGATPAATPALRPGQVASPTLSAVIKHFLQDQGTRGIKEMMKKHELVMPLVLDVIGDKPIAELRQADLLDLFDVMNRLPKHAKYDFVKGKSYREIASIPDRERLGKATFDRTYRASVSTLLDWSKTIYQDQGFPVSLTVEKLDYRGSRKEGENKQRAFTEEELRRIFEGPEMQVFASDSVLAHQYWLPHIGLFTGARVNEICQMNPQTDIVQDPATGTWYFRITEETEGHDDITKSVKTGVNRDVPLHANLLDLGFLNYLKRVRDSGEKLLFPAWKPRGGRAAKDAGEDFIDFLKEIGLHGIKNEKGLAIRGSHAFRHTLLTYGKKQGLNLRCITGHKEKSDNEVADGYEDDTIIAPLTEKKRLLNQLDYGLALFKPVPESCPTRPQ